VKIEVSEVKESRNRQTQDTSLSEPTTVAAEPHLLPPNAPSRARGTLTNLGRPLTLTRHVITHVTRVNLARAAGGEERAHAWKDRGAWRLAKRESTRVPSFLRQYSASILLEEEADVRSAKRVAERQKSAVGNPSKQIHCFPLSRAEMRGMRNGEVEMEYAKTNSASWG
jgi:hypothetical protein